MLVIVTVCPDMVNVIEYVLLVLSSGLDMINVRRSRKSHSTSKSQDVEAASDPHIFIRIQSTGIINEVPGFDPVARAMP